MISSHLVPKRILYDRPCHPLVIGGKLSGPRLISDTKTCSVGSKVTASPPALCMMEPYHFWLLSPIAFHISIVQTCAFQGPAESVVAPCCSPFRVPAVCRSPGWASQCLAIRIHCFVSAPSPGITACRSSSQPSALSVAPTFWEVGSGWVAAAPPHHSSHSPGPHPPPASAPINHSRQVQDTPQLSPYISILLPLPVSTRVGPTLSPFTLSHLVKEVRPSRPWGMCRE